MALTDQKITVVGAGIGGLAAALALCQRGADVTVLERAEAITEVGAGIQISPNGMRVLDALGLGDSVRAGAPRAQAVSLRNARDGAEVARLDPARGQSGALGYHFVHRADLIDLLAGAVRAAGARVRLLQKVARVTPGSQPVLHLENGDTCASDIVIGADGVRSVLRPCVTETSAPFFTRQVAWRAIVPNVTSHPDEARVHMGAGRHIVTYPLRDRSVVNIVAVQERDHWAEEGWHHTDDPDSLRAAFADFCPDIQSLLGQIHQVGLWGLFRHPVAPNWYAPGVVLLGDAAHPTLPFLAQGANLALEDAFVLARCLSDGSGLVRYQALRQPRARRVVAAASGNAWKYHLPPGPVRLAAHTGMRVLSRVAPDRLIGQFGWLYDHDVTA